MSKNGKNESNRQSKDFSLGDVLSIIIGYVFAPRFMKGLRDISDFMGGSPEKCRYHLTTQFPQLFTPEMDKAVLELETALDRCKESEKAKMISISNEWLNKQSVKYGETFAVEPLPKCPTCNQTI
jgi:hypothetical protein